MKAAVTRLRVRNLKSHIKTCILCKFGKHREKGLFRRELFSTFQIWDCLLCISFSFDKPPLWQVSRYLSHLAGYYHSFVRPPSSGMTETYSARHSQPLFARTDIKLDPPLPPAARFSSQKNDIAKECISCLITKHFDSIWQQYAFFIFNNCFVVKKFFLKTVLGNRQVLFTLKKNSNCME